MDDFATPRRGVFPSFLAPAGTPGPHLRTPGPQDRQAQPPSADPVIRANEKRAGAKRYSNLGARFELAHGLATRGELDDAHARRKSGSVSPPGGSPPHRSSRGPVDFKGQGPLDDPRWDTGLVEIPTWQLAGGGAEAAAAARQEAQPSSSPKGTDGDGTAGGGQSLLGKRKPNLSVAALAAAVAAPSKRPQPEGLLAKLERARQERDRARQQQQQATTAAAPA